MGVRTETAAGNIRSAIRAVVKPLYIRTRLVEERLRSGVAWWPLLPGSIADPYPAYKRIRERDPVHRSLITGQYLISRYTDVDRVLRDHRTFSNIRRKGLPSLHRRVDTQQELTPTMIRVDPPDHTRLRALVNMAFIPRQTASMEEFIRTTAHSLLDQVVDAGEFDLMRTFADPLPTLVIAKMVGVPQQDIPRFREWTLKFSRAVDPGHSDAESEEILKLEKQFSDYFTGVIEQRRLDPRDDLVSRLAEAEEQGDKLTSTELTAMLRLIMVAGTETTANLIGNGMRALLQHPDQLALLREKPETIGSAIEELLRYDTPVQMIPRFTTREVEIGGKRLEADSWVAVILGSANRDEEQFARPDEFDITRSDTGNIAFGRGIHHCLGGALARLEGRIALEVLLERLAEIRFGSRLPAYRPNVVLRGLAHLDIRVRWRGITGTGGSSHAAPAESPDSCRS